jgi:hypothetical protein
MVVENSPPSEIAKFLVRGRELQFLSQSSRFLSGFYPAITWMRTMERNRMTSSRSSSVPAWSQDRSLRAPAKYGRSGWDSVGSMEEVGAAALDCLRLMEPETAKSSESLLTCRPTCTFRGRAHLTGPPPLGFGWVSVGAICSGDSMNSLRLSACLQRKRLP